MAPVHPTADPAADPFDDPDDAAAAAGSTETDADNRPSKTRRKKEMHALQALGERLVALPEARLKSVPLDDDLRRAVEMARGIRSHEGKRRQLQYIGRLMRSADAAAIEASLAGDDASHARQVAAHHAAEQWRDGLIDGSRRLADFTARFPLPDADASNALDGLVSAARDAARSGAANPRHARALYRALHQWLTAFENPDR